MCVNQSGKKNRVLGRVHTQPIPTHPAIPISHHSLFLYTPFSNHHIQSCPSSNTPSHHIPFHSILSSHHLIPPYHYPVPSHPLIPPPYPTLPLSRSIPFTHPTFLSYSLPPTCPSFLHMIVNPKECSSIVNIKWQNP